MPIISDSRQKSVTIATSYERTTHFAATQEISRDNLASILTLAPEFFSPAKFLERPHVVPF